jgi:hypothetical protein
VRVAHEFVSDSGLIMGDPEVVFYTLYDEWIPIESTQPISNNTTLGQFDGNRAYAELSATGKYIKSVDFDNQKNLAVFVKNWFKCLKADGWATMRPMQILRTNRPPWTMLLRKMTKAIWSRASWSMLNLALAELSN